MNRFIATPAAASALTFAASAAHAITIDGTHTGAAPEAGVWALMLVGFGVIGAMLRRRKVAFA